MTESRPYQNASDDALDDETVDGIAEANRRGLLPERFQRSAAACQAQIDQLRAEHWQALRTGEVQARSTRQLDCDPRTGTYLIRTRSHGGPWSRPRVVAVSRVCPQRGSVTAARRPAGREARPGQRGRRARRHAASILRDDGDGPDGEPDPEPDPWTWLVRARLIAAEAQGAADRIAAGGDELIPVFRRLPERLREQQDRAAHTGTEGGRR